MANCFAWAPVLIASPGCSLPFVISAASGVPTYRGVGGLYGDRVTDEGMRIEEALSGPVFRRAPELTWKYIHQIEKACRGASPNGAHAALARLEARLARSLLLTQNVDGFHRAAGSRNVIDIHGDIHRLLCTACSFADVVAMFDVVIESSVVGVRKPETRFYEIALEALGISAEQAVFLDDLGINLKPARALGMTTIKVDDPAVALDELEAVLGMRLRD